MTKKEEFKNSILTAMRVHLDAIAFGILEATLVAVMHNIDIVDMSTLPATADYTNEYIWEVFMARKAPKLSAKTVEAYKNTLDDFVRIINKSLLHVDANDVEYYLLQKKREGNSNVSLNNKRRNLAAFFSWMRKGHIIPVNPAENVEKYAEIEKPIDHMEPSEVEQLKTGCKTSRDRALIEWLRCTAMRGGEIPQININQVDWNTGLITIFGQKGHAYRPVCLDTVALGYIKVYLQDRGEDLTSSKPLFVHLRKPGTALSRSGICGAVKAIGKRAGLQRNVYTHLFRKTTATNIIKRGGSDADAGEYLGHKPSTVTGRHYTYKSEDRIISIFKSYVQAV